MHIVQNVLAPPNKNSNNKFTDYVYNYLISKKKKITVVDECGKTGKKFKKPENPIRMYNGILAYNLKLIFKNVSS